MRIGSLFSGAGGLDLAVEQVFGGETVWHCELDTAASKVLAARWPRVPNLGDITQIDWLAAVGTEYEIEPVDILCGGYPCQPFSAAGKRKGSTDERHLWPYFAEAIRCLRPRFVVLENVAGHRSMGFDRVLADLAGIGYDAQWCSLRASDVGAPHRRERIFVVAHPDSASGEAFGGRPWAGDTRRLQPMERGGEDRQRPTAHSPRDGRHEGRPEPARLIGGSDAAVGRDGPVDLLPTPRSSDCFGPGLHGDGGMDLRTAMSELAKENADAAPEGRSGEELRDMRDSVDPQEIREWPARGPQRVPETPSLLPIMREFSDDSAAGFTPLAGQATQADGSMRGLRHDGEVARTPQGSQPGEQCTGEPGGALQQLPSQAALAGRSRVQGAEDSRIRWGKYGPAIARWEAVLGRPAPNPTEPNSKGNPRLSAEFSSWMMGWPAGWVTAVPGISRNDALRIVGNGVVPQQATAALQWLLAVAEQAA